MPPTVADMENPSVLRLATIGGMKANEEPRNTGTIILVRKWKIRVPTPAASRATDASNPVRRGTSTVAPNMATVC